MPRSEAPGLDGVLVVAKPTGPTSHDVVALVRRLAATKRVGHGGTLDPFASGVLPLFLGRATRVAEFHLGAPKAYRATVCFGASSTTDDLEGELTPTGEAPSRQAVEAALPTFVGTIRQRPPAYSAVKIGGRRAYALARRGESPELSEREVTIIRLELVAWDDSDDSRPIAEIEMDCSAGTYVRALARDLGAAVGSGAYLGALTRLRSGPFALSDARSLDEIRGAAADGGPAGIARLLLPIDVGLDELPAVELDAVQLGAIARGQLVRPKGARPADGTIRILGPNGRLAALGRWSGGRLAPTKVLVDVPATISTGAREHAARPEREPGVGGRRARESSPATAAEPDAPSWPSDEPNAAEVPPPPEVVSPPPDVAGEPVEAALAAERDPAESIDPDPASPDDG